MSMTIDEMRACFPCRDVKCARCGENFVVNARVGGRTKYCRKCALEVRRESDRRKHKKIRDENKASLPKPRTRKAPKRVSQIDNICKAARAAGMSYGRYKAMMEKEVSQ